LERIGAVMEQKWSLEGKVGKEESGDDVEGWSQRKLEERDSVVHLLLVYWFCFFSF